MGWNKYNAVKTKVDGITFDSKKEAARYVELRDLKRAGVISDLELQPKIELMGQCGPILTPTGKQATYRPDFGYVENGRQIYEDAKGYLTRDSSLRIEIARAMGLRVILT